MSDDKRDSTENRDPITGTPGAHPVGTGLGAAAGGAAAGAAVGTVAGPLGTAVGAAVGAVAGGLLGKGVAEGLDPTVEDAYWRENYSRRPYVDAGSRYERFQPAYRYGWEARARLGERSWDEAESQLRADWESHPDSLSLDWDSASGAVRDAWDRVPLEPGSPVNRV
jgi:phage tail tape-measure protein